MKNLKTITTKTSLWSTCPSRFSSKCCKYTGFMSSLSMHRSTIPLDHLYSQPKIILYTSCSPGLSGFRIWSSTCFWKDLPKLTFWNKKTTQLPTWSSAWLHSWPSTPGTSKNPTLLSMKSSKAHPSTSRNTTTANPSWCRSNQLAPCPDDRPTNSQPSVKSNPFTQDLAKHLILRPSTISSSIQRMFTWNRMRVFNVWWCNLWAWWSVERLFLVRKLATRSMNHQLILPSLLDFTQVWTFRVRCFPTCGFWRISKTNFTHFCRRGTHRCNWNKRFWNFCTKW